jgi:hypothetical protein
MMINPKYVYGEWMILLIGKMKCSPIASTQNVLRYVGGKSLFLMHSSHQRPTRSGAGATPALVGGEYRVWFAGGAVVISPSLAALRSQLTREPGVLDAIILSHLVHPRNAVNLLIDCSTMLHSRYDGQYS